MLPRGVGRTTALVMSNFFVISLTRLSVGDDAVLCNHVPCLEAAD